MFTLTDTQRIAILSGCVGLVVTALLITLCFVCPFCYINRRLARKSKKQEEMRMACFKNSNHYYHTSLVLDKEPPPPYDHANSFNESVAQMNRISISSYASSDVESVTGIPLPIMSDAEMATFDIPEHQPSERGHVNITLHYKRITSDDQKVFPQLRVDLKEAGELQSRAYGGRCNPYLIIGLYDLKNYNKKKRRKSSGAIPLYEFYSTMVKKCHHPIYNESFFFPMEQNLLKKCILKLEAWDSDSLVNDTALGECVFNLKDVASILIEEPTKELDMHLKLEDAKVNNGQLLLGLCYLPTAERMTVAVLKASSLKLAPEDSESKADFFVQAMAIYNGKIIERRKTSRRPLSSYPVFNEMLMFDVPSTKLDHVTLLLAVYKTSQHDPSIRDRSPGKERCLGKVVIGSSNGRKHSLNHWNAMKHSPRRQIIQWHELR